VLSFIGSYTNLRGGDIYIDLIRKSEPHPLRVFLQDGSNDLNIFAGSWYMANQGMAKSLAYAGYDVRFEVGTEGHNAKQGGAILPDALKWLWRDYPKPILASQGGGGERQFVTEILDPNHDWELAGEGYDFAEGLATDPSGNVFFCDSASSKIYKMAAADGKVSVFRDATAGTTGLAFSADGTLYAAEAGRLRVASYLPAGQMSVLSLGLQASDLALSAGRGVYFSESGRGRIWLINTANEKRVVFDNTKDGNIQTPYTVRVLPDNSGLIITDFDARSSWSFRFGPNGSLVDGEPYYHLEIPDLMAQGQLRSGARGVAFDDQGYAYFATALGVQICDQPGRVVGIIRKPGPGELTDVTIGGADKQMLYVTAGTKIYRRHLRRRGVLPGANVVLPKPQL
jgi:sugar lactone lactonase YvrE